MTRRDPIKDRLLWSLVSAAGVAIAASLAQAAVVFAWQKVTHRPPPKSLMLIAPAGRKAGLGAAGLLLDRLAFMRALRA
jgi:hypothetical protein